MAAGDGLISMTPTSIAYSGTSASINADGGVDFSAVTSLSLNGVFTGDYDNYLIVVNGNASANTQLDFRWRASGVDNSTASSYVWQNLDVYSTVVAGSRSTQTFGRLIAGVGGFHRYGFSAHAYGPYLAQPTAWRSVTVSDNNGAAIPEFAGTHNQSTSYDGFTLIMNNAATGTVHVFGYEE